MEDLARLSFQSTPIYVDVDEGRRKVSGNWKSMVHLQQSLYSLLSIVCFHNKILPIFLYIVGYQ